jgi:predicted amino acid dehydrogenase
MRGKYAFIVHSRDRKDLPRKFPFLSFLPTFVFDLITLHLRPILVSKIEGLKDENGNSIEGMVIGVPMTAHQLLENRSLAVDRIVQAVRLAKSNGADFIGLGAMTASLTKGGLDVIERVNDVVITTGRTYTVKNLTDHVEFFLKKFNLKISDIRVAIVGAAGGIGSGTAISLAKKGVKRFILIDLERKMIHLKKHLEILEHHAPDLEIELTHRLSAVADANFVITATSAPEAVIESKDISQGTIIINDAQPSDISEEILTLRPDVLVVEGGVLETPSIDCHFNFGLADKRSIFSCLAETILLAYNKDKEHLSMNSFDGLLYNRLENDGKKLGFGIKVPQNKYGYLSEKQMIEFARINSLNI